MPDKSENWAAFYAGNDPGYRIHTTDPTIMALIQKIVPMGDDYIEWGYGLGYVAIALANLGKSVIAYDPEIGLISHAMKARDEYLKSLKGKIGFACDKQVLPPADIVYSQGLLEHFGYAEICSILEEQLSFAQKAVIFSVPSANYPQQDFGDERLLKLEEWETILSPFSKKITQLQYYEREMHLMGVIRK
jgi:hypothetical protein